MTSVYCYNRYCVYNKEGKCFRDVVDFEAEKCNSFEANYNSLNYQASKGIFIELYNIISRVPTSKMSEKEYKASREFSRFINDNFSLDKSQSE